MDVWEDRETKKPRHIQDDSANRCVALSRQHGRKSYFAVDGLLENVLDSRADFRAVAIDDPALLSGLEWAARHHFEQHTFRSRRIIAHLRADGFRLTEIGQQLQFFVYLRLLHLAGNR